MTNVFVKISSLKHKNGRLLEHCEHLKTNKHMKDFIIRCFQRLLTRNDFTPALRVPAARSCGEKTFPANSEAQ